MRGSRTRWASTPNASGACRAPTAVVAPTAAVAPGPRIAASAPDPGSTHDPTAPPVIETASAVRPGDATPTPPPSGGTRRGRGTKAALVAAPATPAAGTAADLPDRPDGPDRPPLRIPTPTPRPPVRPRCSSMRGG
ncbi:hypothetical protein ACFSM7_04960 [Clavibacter michiganensis subsp. tessellarius]|uniref:hypothetical protein n=1 Tax=Clavibacter tessellarius TaxID=31965 RepID=UPI00363E98BB